jgi:hypothetical protein
LLSGFTVRKIGHIVTVNERKTVYNVVLHIYIYRALLRKLLVKNSPSFMEPDGSFPGSKGSFAIPNQMNLFHILSSHFKKTNFDAELPLHQMF